MESCILVGTDGSDDAVGAASTGLSLLRPASRVVIAAVVPPEDPMLVSGTGFAGGVMSPEALDQLVQEQREDAEDALRRTTRAAGIEEADALVVRGDAGRELCELAARLPASVLVVGSRGRGAIARALLGSVSSYVVGHAPCPVLVVRAQEPSD